MKVINAKQSKFTCFFLQLHDLSEHVFQVRDSGLHDFLDGIGLDHSPVIRLSTLQWLMSFMN